MAIPLKDILAKKSPERQAKIKAMAKKMIKQELAKRRKRARSK